jgi:hypothetical protein
MAGRLARTSAVVRETTHREFVPSNRANNAEVSKKWSFSSSRSKHDIPILLEHDIRILPLQQKHRFLAPRAWCCEGLFFDSSFIYKVEVIHRRRVFVEVLLR